MIQRIKNKIQFERTRFLQRIREKVMILGSGSNRWARIYYAFFDDSFVREQRAVLQGKVTHISGFQSGVFNEYKLRRNIHRLEKGLIQPERKEVFGLGYIRETVTAYIQEVKREGHDKNLLEWAGDVLALYFQTVKPEGVIAGEFNRFSKVHPNNNNTFKKIPHLRLSGKEHVLDYDGFLRLCKQRVSTRTFEDKAVPKELLEKAFAAALTAPSACNRQAFEFRLFQKREEVDRLIKLPGGISGFDKEVPVLAFLIGDLSAYFDERDRHLIYIDGGLVAMGLMLALETLGLASCALNWPDIEERELALEKELGLEKHKRCIMALILGYPAEKAMIPCSPKKTLKQTVSFS
jgi:nitroreductase